MGDKSRQRRNASAQSAADERDDDSQAAIQASCETPLLVAAASGVHHGGASTLPRGVNLAQSIQIARLRPRLGMTSQLFGQMTLR